LFCPLAFKASTPEIKNRTVDNITARRPPAVFRNLPAMPEKSFGSNCFVLSAICPSPKLCAQAPAPNFGAAVPIVQSNLIFSIKGENRINFP
jgi:hypothetical protein